MVPCLTGIEPALRVVAQHAVYLAQQLQRLQRRDAGMVELRVEQRLALAHEVRRVFVRVVLGEGQGADLGLVGDGGGPCEDAAEQELAAILGLARLEVV